MRGERRQRALPRSPAAGVILIDRRRFLISPLALACAAGQPPNLLLIVAGGWRGQAVPWAEDPDLIAPNLTKFGEQSVVFSRAYCCSPKAELARTALATSRFPHAANLHDEALGGIENSSLDAAVQKTPFAAQIDLPSPAGAPHVPMVHLRGNVRPADSAAARDELAAFYGVRRRQDEALGEILAALDKRNLARDTIVCFTSDCGSQMYSHGIDGAEVPFEESVRIPLAIRYPRTLEPQARDLASQIDILPTLLALRGMEIPQAAQGVDLFGKNRPEVVFAEGKLGEAGEWRMLVRGYDKVIATPKGDITGLFNLAEDPFEMANVVHDPARRLMLASLKAQLLAEQKKLFDGMDPSGLRRR